MRIEYFCAENIANIYSAMKKRKIEIDFTKCKNRVILLVGPNGTGKTSILSMLQPFAYPGSMDIRNSEDLVLEGKDGYKEIHIRDGENLYVIKHHYLWNRGNRNLKSFISKNGVELNTNGLVNSFKELVKMELGVEQDFFKLLRLGSNVTTFIDMKASDRKGFASELLSEIDIYAQFHKKINEDTRILKTVLKSVTEKIDRLRIVDENELKDKISILEIDLSNLRAEKDNVNAELWQLIGELNALLPEGVEVFISSFNEDENEYKNLINEIKTNQLKLNKSDTIIIGNIDETIAGVEKRISSSENSVITNSSMIQFYFTQLESLYNQKEEKEGSLKYVTSDTEYTKLKSLYLKLHDRKSILEKVYKNYKPKCTKEDIKTALRLMQEIDTLIGNIHEFNHDAVVDVITHILNKMNVDSIVKKEVLSIDEKMTKYNLDILRIGNTIGIKNGGYVLYKPTECTVKSCPYFKFYEDHTGQTNDTSVDKISAEMKKLELKREYFLSMSDINRNIDYILLILNTNKELIKRMPENFFDINVIFNSIKDCVPFYEEEKVTHYIIILEEYEEYIELQSKIKEVKKEITFIESNANSVASIQKDLFEIDSKIYEIEKQIANLKDENEKLNSKIERFNTLKESYVESKILLDEIRSKSEEAESLLSSLEERMKIKTKLSEFIEKKASIEDRIKKLEDRIKNVEEEINNNKFKLREFHNLNAEKALLDEKFDEINLIKETVSSNTGIPLLYIAIYMKNSTQIINELLDIVYKGELEIDEFKVNDKEFRIPYFKNGLRVNDVAFCSQGERSFVSLAISFALIRQSIDKYNIMLLDEIDSTLDQSKRHMFLRILERQLESINSEQVFAITHNNAFDNYPVDLILTADYEVDNYKNMNVIFKA